MGFDDAYYTIGEMYEYGEHGSADFATARGYYEKAVLTGNPSAQVWLFTKWVVQYSINYQ
jgi:TPR repeat protein